MNHASKQYDLDLNDIHSKVLQMAGLVEAQFCDAVQAYLSNDKVAAAKVVAMDEEVNSMELALDDACVHLIVRRQPAANDLRAVMATLKIVTDIERMGDESAKIARIVLNAPEDKRDIKTLTNFDPNATIRVAYDLAVSQLRSALDTFARQDVDSAMRVIRDDKTLDQAYRLLLQSVIQVMQGDSSTITTALDCMAVGRAIERIGDHTKNIAEYVVFVVAGKDIRHKNSSNDM